MIALFLGIVIVVGVLSLAYLLHRYPVTLTFRFVKRDDTPAIDPGVAFMEAQRQEAEVKKARENISRFQPPSI